MATLETKIGQLSKVKIIVNDSMIEVYAQFPDDRGRKGYTQLEEAIFRYGRGKDAGRLITYNGSIPTLSPEGTKISERIYWVLERSRSSVEPKRDDKVKDIDEKRVFCAALNLLLGKYKDCKNSDLSYDPERLAIENERALNGTKKDNYNPLLSGPTPKMQAGSSRGLSGGAHYNPGNSTHPKNKKTSSSSSTKIDNKYLPKSVSAHRNNPKGFGTSDYDYSDDYYKSGPSSKGNKKPGNGGGDISSG